MKNKKHQKVNKQTDHSSPLKQSTQNTQNTEWAFLFKTDTRIQVQRINSILPWFLVDMFIK
jgi:hypothetical protein